MHGLGNDFVILDARKNGFKPAPAQIRSIADRNRGIGCDQLIVLEPAANGKARLAMRIFNADGGESGACGNAARCVGRLETEAGAPSEFLMEAGGGLLSVHVGKESVAVDMGSARTEWKDIPLSREADTLKLEIGKNFGLSSAVAVNMGNPHAVFFVEDTGKIDVAKIGPEIERDPLFPEHTNVEFASVKDRRTIRMRVWERGAGITLACGSGACATLVAAARRGLTEREADIIVDGGTLHITWFPNNHVLMEGPASYSFSGEIPDELLNGVRT